MAHKEVESTHGGLIPNFSSLRCVPLRSNDLTRDRPRPCPNSPSPQPFHFPTLPIQCPASASASTSKSQPLDDHLFFVDYDHRLTLRVSQIPRPNMHFLLPDRPQARISPHRLRAVLPQRIPGLVRRRPIRRTTLAAFSHDQDPQLVWQRGCYVRADSRQCEKIGWG